MPPYKADRQAITIAIFFLVSLIVASCGSTAGNDESQLTSQEAAFTTTGERQGTTPVSTVPPTSQPSPTSNPYPVATATSSLPAIENLTISKVGFSKASGQIAYAFEVSNPNDTAVIESIYQVMVLDANGLSLGSDVGRLPLLLPGQQLGIAASLAMEDVEDVEQIELLVTPGETFALDTLPDLTVLDIYYQPSEFYDQVNGLIGNDGDRDLEDIRVSAIAYDENDEIVGAGYTFLSFLPAGERAGISIVLTTAKQVDHIKLFPRASLASLIQLPASRPAYTAGMVLLDSGFSQADIEVSYGILVDNPNISYSLLDAEYRATFLNAAGKVIAVDVGYIDLLLPQQTWGIGDRVFVDEGERVATMNILTRVNRYQTTLYKPALVVENVAVITNTHGIRVTGELLNPYQTTLNEVRISTLVYNSDGRIIGGGIEYLDNVPPGVSVPVEVQVTSAEPVSMANLYAGLTKIISD